MSERTVDTSAAVHGDPAPGLLEAFWAYERALMADDVAALDALFAPGPDTMRGDATGLLVGHDAISAFRRGRGGAPERRIAAVHVRVLGDGAAAVVAELEPVAGGRGQQTQVWRRTDAGWQVAVAHVSGPAPAVDPRMWRTAGTPLVAGAGTGPLAGQRVAVKDLFAVAGYRVGGGVPAYLAEAVVESRTAPAVQALLDAGADVTGISRTDEFAYSLGGANPHYGTPPNARVPGGLPGGSSSGSASAVALGQVSIGLGTDTGGSIRVPASYQGLWGLRTTHGTVSTDGLLPLAPSFDTVGWLTRDLGLLRAVAAVNLAGRPRVEAGDRLATAPALLDLLEPSARTAFDDRVARLTGARLEHVDVGDIEEAFQAFRVLQAYEAWQVHGAWIGAHPGAVTGPEAERFRLASQIDADEAGAARRTVERRRAELRDLLDGRVLVIPSASTPAPSATADAATIDRTRFGTLRLTCIAGIAGAPGLGMPLAEVAGAPLGVCLVGAPGTDLALLDLAAALLA